MCKRNKETTSEQQKQDQQDLRKMVQRKAPLNIIRDSMGRKTPEYVKCSMNGSGYTSLSGAHMDGIKKRAKETVVMEDEGMLLI